MIALVVTPGDWGQINSKFVLKSLLNGGNPRTQLFAKFKIQNYGTPGRGNN
ncbi:hypothetical protein FDUTEX481_04986 [Tolypothrix sp. PCC 7601]|nr:hypothetical protein FDUTEX481_04986 [Tolypothrix sp. PCC 7601]